MRLDRLKIPVYRNLRGFEIDFDESQATTVLLGQNGTGKSNLIEALVEIFRELELGAVPGFSYELDYVCRDQAIHIDADPQRKRGPLNVSVDGKRITKKAFQEEIDTYLPSYVFAYYSGWSSRLEQHFDRSTRRHYDRILRSPDREMPLRRLFFCRKHYSQLVLLAFFLAQPAATRELLEKYLNIKRFERCAFRPQDAVVAGGAGRRVRSSRPRETPASGMPGVRSRAFSIAFGTAHWPRSVTPRPSNATSAVRVNPLNASTSLSRTRMNSPRSRNPVRTRRPSSVTSRASSSVT